MRRGDLLGAFLALVVGAACSSASSGGETPGVDGGVPANDGGGGGDDAGPGGDDGGGKPDGPTSSCGDVGGPCCGTSLHTCNNGAACEANKCIAGVGTKETFANVSAAELIVHGGYAYYRDEGKGIFRKPLAGGGAAQVVDSATTAHHLTGVDDTHAYFWDQGALVKTPIGGGARTTLASSLDVALYGLYVDDTHVYFSSAPKSGTIHFTFARVPIGGGALDTIADSPGGRIDGIATDAAFIYTRGYDGTIVRWDRTTKTPTSLPGTATFGQGFTITTTDVLWSDSVGDPTKGTGHVQSVPKIGGTVTELGTLPHRPGTLTTDAAKAYAGVDESEFTNGTIHAIPLGGGAAVLVANGLHSPAAIAVDSGSLYFINRYVGLGGPIMRVALP